MSGVIDFLVYCLRRCDNASHRIREGILSLRRAADENNDIMKLAHRASFTSLRLSSP